MPERAVGRQPSQGEAGRPRIAVVDDDRWFLELMDRILTDEGYQVDTCASPEAALRTIKEAGSQLVVLDIVMSGGSSGWAVLEQLGNDPDTASLPVIVCSAADRALDEQRSVLDGRGVQVLKKPFDIDALLELVRRALGGPDSEPAP